MRSPAGLKREAEAAPESDTDMADNSAAASSSAALPNKLSKKERQKQKQNLHEDRKSMLRADQESFAENAFFRAEVFQQAAGVYQQAFEAALEQMDLVQQRAVPERKFINGQSVLQWWAGWMQGAAEVPKQISGSRRPKWYSGEIIAHTGECRPGGPHLLQNDIRRGGVQKSCIREQFFDRCLEDLQPDNPFRHFRLLKGLSGFNSLSRQCVDTAGASLAGVALAGPEVRGSS